ncbi:uncharacterized protein Dmoj_GI26248 [Drosophila mojavensis]|uniref:Uncharacterized protein n=1 Tax=Drosophila mojavensis TaxID=7230 RepID=A0A0Q9XJH1_DROMO|nr:uncharacterized protein Dmoj_GI26248 [Drosophila mojavensis]
MIYSIIKQNSKELEAKKPMQCELQILLIPDGFAWKAALAITMNKPNGTLRQKCADLSCHQ